MAKKRLQKWLALCLAVSMLMGTTAMAVDTSEEQTTGLVEVETRCGKKETVDVVIEIEKKDDTTKKTEKAKNFKTESEAFVDYKGSSEFKNDGTGSYESEYTVDKGKYSAEGGSEKTVEKGAPGGITVDVPLTSEEGKNKNTMQGDEAGKTTIIFGDPKMSEEDGVYDYTQTVVKDQGSVTVETKEIIKAETVLPKKESQTDLEYTHDDTAPTATNDLITELPSAAPEQYEPGQSTSATTGEYGFEYIGTGNTSQFRPAMVFTEAMTDEEKIARYGNEAYLLYAYRNYDALRPDDVAASDVFKGTETNVNGSAFAVDKDGNKIVVPDQTVVGPDGKTYYLHRVGFLGDAQQVEGWYQDGEWVKELNAPVVYDENGKVVLEKVGLVDEDGNPILDENGNQQMVTLGRYKNNSLGKDENGNLLVQYGAVYATAQQFILADKETGELVTVYCADIGTPAHVGIDYKIENLEDATYYSDEQAAMIRTIANNGYWGTTEGEPGSLSKMQETMRNAKDANGNDIFTKEEIEALTDGIALTATQMAIWSCSNHMAGTEFVNTHYIGAPEDTEVAGGGTTGMGNIPDGKIDEAKLMFKVYEYLKSLEPTEVTNPNTQNTIINADNFLKDLDVTVVEKVKGHDNNKDDKDDNDAYTTDISFALVVTPSAENDDLIVRVYGEDLSTPLAEGRIAGKNDEGENYQDLTKDENGNYVFKGITMIEGDQNFSITLEGVQHLEEGVYLYSAEVGEYDRDENGEIEDMNAFGYNEKEVPSQTMVGVAKGKRDVSVEMNIRFELNVEDEIVATERYWRNERIDGDDDDDDDIFGDDDDDDTDIGDDDVPQGEFPGDDDDDDTDNIPEEDVPLVEMPEEDVPLEELPEDDVPLAEVPKTGDASILWFALSALSGAGLMGLNIGRKREDEE